MIHRKIYQYAKAFSSDPKLAADLILEKIPSTNNSITPALPKQAILITYGDQISDDQQRYSPLNQQHLWLKQHMGDVLSAVHILPFYPFTSDDGFSVQDYRNVNEAMGDWHDIKAMSGDFDLMFDAVINHCSKSHRWFVDYLLQKPYAKDYFIAHDPSDLELKKVTRPRTSPLLHPFQTSSGKPRYLWTTFSEDQIDLNFANPQLLAEIVDILLLYIRQGAKYIRLDAVTFAIKKRGTNCASLPQTHQLVKLLRYILSQVAPNVVLITETNVPHLENISYFGSGDEAQMVYNFALAPLLIHAALRQDASILARWANNLEQPPKNCSYFNMTAVHDGIGVRGASAELSSQEIDYMAKICLARGGQIQYGTFNDKAKSPYELCITFFDMLTPKDEKHMEHSINRFMLTQYFAMTLRGVPAIYFHNLLASTSWQEGYLQTRQGRSLNRKKFTLSELNALITKDAKTAMIFKKMKQALALYHHLDALGPYADQTIIMENAQVIGIKRGDNFIAYFNFSNQAQVITIEAAMMDCLSGNIYEGKISLSPWQTLWLIQ